MLKRSARKFQQDQPINMAGTLAFFTIFAIPPIVIIITSVIGAVVGKDQVSSKLYEQVQELMGKQGVSFVKDLVSNYQGQDQGTFGTIFGIVVFVMAASTFFVIIQKSLNTIWQVKPKPQSNALKFLKDRGLSFGMILSLGFVLLVSLVVDAALAFLKDYINQLLQGVTFYLIQGINFIVSFGLVAFIIAVIYRFLPDVKIKWGVAWVGAFVTAALFTLGKYIIGFALGNSNVGSMYGAAGSVVIILLWVFYSAMIIFFGAEITAVYAIMQGQEIEPKEHSVRVITKEVETKKGEDVKKEEG